MAAVAALATYMLCTAFVRSFGDKTWSISIPELYQNTLGGSVFKHIQNNTLGFEHIYAISMKERTDKRDFLTLAASISGFKVKWLDGVRPDDLHPKAMPDGLDPLSREVHCCGMLGVISNDYSTALILEDDADWDEPITYPKKLLTEQIGISSGSADFASGLNANETSFYAIPMDPTVPRVHHRATWGGPTEKWKQQYPELAEDSTRFIYRAEMGCCMFGYAVTTSGARNILSALSIDHLDKPVDDSLSELKAGSASRDSDMENNNAADFHEEQA
ncbi:hypothetical protein PENNAL_c0001G02128 [Penicillium nalgiovense]|uniref:Glycosyl transferase 64 domain-containing protein n=1 Tax=Penicillium nalgiovense TaxID=60175 RepID=A0A1V6ZAK7_PENNA|nr:hypothetical protein PENNAL_c0001G02128 [Penicillium nalgiovense]